MRINTSALVLQVCFKQNIHGRSLAEISAMAKAWEAAPPNYTLATADSLFKEEGARCSSCVGICVEVTLQQTD
jgi:hypothetical protein